ELRFETWEIALHHERRYRVILVRNGDIVPLKYLISPFLSVNRESRYFALKTYPLPVRVRLPRAQTIVGVVMPDPPPPETLSDGEGSLRCLMGALDADATEPSATIHISLEHDAFILDPNPSPFKGGRGIRQPAAGLNWTYGTIELTVHHWHTGPCVQRISISRALLPPRHLRGTSTFQGLIRCSSPDYKAIYHYQTLDIDISADFFEAALPELMKLCVESGVQLLPLHRQNWTVSIESSCNGYATVLETADARPEYPARVHEANKKMEDIIIGWSGRTFLSRSL
ncbi:hypothetical protein GGS23DRAFT_614602, partial [Durotheca rogersii]|uniref:uncharacterized protein n=1 Tax=Durotheca rogersii TaxID=419775 RepID=UPI00221F8B81